MTRSLPRFHLHQRDLLQGDWFLCAAPPAGPEQTAPPADSLWWPIRQAMPAAAALRELGRWSLDDNARRFDAEDWWYRLRFDTAPPNADERLVLGFDGLATLAQVWLNGQSLLSSSNMFVAHECEVNALLQPAGNELLIRFSALDAQLAVKRKRPRWRAPMVEHQQLRWFRTTLLGRTPGWSPPAAVVGPWKDIWLERRADLDLKTLDIATAVNDGDGLFTCRLDLEPLGRHGIEAASLQLERGGRSWVQRLTRVPDSWRFSGELRIPEVDLWWPHTHGEAALYQASLHIRMADGPAKTIDLGRMGFRTVTLDTGNGGLALRINGATIFCRGACWTPLDPVTLRSPARETRDAVAQARLAGMNLLRVSGTMAYEDAHFYDACDEQGMLVWQDFMFANMDYPQDDPAFMACVAIEAGQQLQRWQARACLVLLCGNSEVEQQAAMWGAPRELWQPGLLGKALAELCAELAPGTPYWPSSAHGGAFPHQASEGSCSYYGVGAYLQPLSDARRAAVKFASECLAFANIPSPATLARLPGGPQARMHHAAWKARSPRDLGAGWDFDDVRDHYLQVLFNVDARQLRYADHERYLLLGRVTTGEVMAASFNEWRRPASSCRGAMVLFLRDLWAGAGWGLVDDRGAPKACYHYLKRALQPVTVMLSDEGLNGLQVHLINERGEARTVELELTAWREGDTQVASTSTPMTLAPRSAQSLNSLDLFDHFIDLTDAYRFGPRSCDAVVATLRDPQKKPLAQAFYFPGGLSALMENDIGLTARAIMLDDHTACLTVATRQLAQGVHLEAPGYEADTDYFHLAPNTEMELFLRATSTHPLMGWVRSVNSKKAAQIEMAPPVCSQQPEQTK